MKNAQVKLTVVVDQNDNRLLNDVIGMVARLVYLLIRIPGVKASFFVQDEEI